MWGIFQGLLFQSVEYLKKYAKSAEKQRSQGILAGLCEKGVVHPSTITRLSYGAGGAGESAPQLNTQRVAV
jgi:hypothetical protein